MTNVDQAVIDIARDAIREGRASDVAGIVADQPKMLLIAEMARALYALCQSAGVAYLAMHMHGGPPSFNMHHGDITALAADIALSGGKLTKGPEIVDGEESRWKSLVADINGIKCDAIGEHARLTAERNAESK